MKNNHPLNNRTVLVIGSGPIVIGQACEFDYSGTQACLVLKSEGIKTVLLNPNPATIMTDKFCADVVYFEPINVEVAERIIKKEKVTAILPTMGGQTALNLACALNEKGILRKYKLQVLGSSIKSIMLAEDRSYFRDVLSSLSLNYAKSICITEKDIANIESIIHQLPLPAIVRSSYTLGGAGGGIAQTYEELHEIIKRSVSLSPKNITTVEQSLIGWKEFELEAIRDCKGNCIIVCSIENIDPMGVHTGDSITVAPSLTLSDKELQALRNTTILLMNTLNIIGGANVQFAINPNNGEIMVIEINPRVSRSSALASKATGYPIAKVSTYVALGHTLDEINNEITNKTAFFEPAIDYIVTKMPQFEFSKFYIHSPKLDIYMQSIGEAMGIGRTFIESFQKAINSLNTNLSTIREKIKKLSLDELKYSLQERIPFKFLFIEEAFNRVSLEEICRLVDWDAWFVHQLFQYYQAKNFIQNNHLLGNKEKILELKKQSVSDEEISGLLNIPIDKVLVIRENEQIFPTYHMVDTCAGEFPSTTPCLYSTYLSGDNFLEINEIPLSNKEKILVVGSGPNRIGQGIEFDYGCVHAVKAIQDLGLEAMIINSNPETVSTDYAIVDKLYFDPINLESIFNIVQAERVLGSFKGVLTQFGGQTSLNLAKAIFTHKRDIPIIGITKKQLNYTEDRQCFYELMDKLGIEHIKGVSINKQEDLVTCSRKLRFPLVMRPSFIIGGDFMEIIHSEADLKTLCLDETNPIAVEEYLKFAIELDVDVISDGVETKIIGILENIEPVGIHSGDSTCIYPAISISKKQKFEILNIVKQIANYLKVTGVFNVQLAVKEDKIFVIEVNLRASRTIPFLSKVHQISFAGMATRVLLGSEIDKNIQWQDPKDLFFVKTPIFSTPKGTKEYILKGPNMKSTGEAMTIDSNLHEAISKGLTNLEDNLRKKPKIILLFDRETTKAHLNKVMNTVQKLAEVGIKCVTNLKFDFSKPNSNVYIMDTQTIQQTIYEELAAARVSYMIHNSSLLVRELLEYKDITKQLLRSNATELGSLLYLETFLYQVLKNNKKVLGPA